MKTISLLLCVISAAVLLISGCGLKGDLYLPEQSESASLAPSNNK